MTYVVGQSFNTFAAFPLAPHPSQAAKDALLHGVGFAALELVALGCGALLMSSVTSSLAAGQLIHYNINCSCTRIHLISSLDPCHPLRSPFSYPHPGFLSGFCNTSSHTRKNPHRSCSFPRLPRRVKYWCGQRSKCSLLRAHSPYTCRVCRSVARCYLGCHCRDKSFVTMAMFVQGFWYGAHLVLQGKNKPGTS
ncbi:hypothetical protein OG21DRAFT_1052270 [Imleria badia]|nr:hypothetical protein OG21DRAFT_1052270 [Imleria badia]